ncbi:fumarylacetoacetate hydrolase family protein [Cognatishimia activa]|uniref:Fumarylacetoacetate hydrolase family protein n=1 Tax=Cognatishimia activa TaxID=1715691 RepID=A0A975EN58_9RHOB|nr:fumarylacetoacetate hydrolase family protein [Cognatishimia activa]QTN35130.1 fumarylacetoacetate hydrolase family protein [Cognatishimia activa]
MKLQRFQNAEGSIIPAASMDGDTWHGLETICDDISPDAFAEGLMDRLASIDINTLEQLDTAGLSIATPIAQPRNIWCIGLNYSDHAEEAGLPIPEEPILFSKSSATFCEANADIPYPPHMTKLDWEVELALVIGKTALCVSMEDALDYVAGYTLANDVSERAWQIERGGQWVKGKSFPNFCPTGPMLVTPDEIADVQNLEMWLDVNGTRKQTGNTSKMIFDVRTIIHHVSQFVQLETGDLILTGTPPGVGMGFKPPQYLKPGDVVELGITGLGQQRQTVVAWD